MASKRIRGAISEQITIGQANAIKQVRKAVKGLRLSHLPFITLIGNRDSVTCIEVAYITSVDRSTVYQSLLRVIDTGFVYKANKRYYLTDKGKEVHSIYTKQLAYEFKEIINYVAEQAQKYGSPV